MWSFYVADSKHSSLQVSQGWKGKTSHAWDTALICVLPGRQKEPMRFYFFKKATLESDMKRGAWVQTAMERPLKQLLSVHKRNTEIHIVSAKTCVFSN